MFTIEMLPAAHGDALWVEYGSAAQPSRIVIDGGPASTYARGLKARAEWMTAHGANTIDLFVVSHIDCDHIDGAIIFLRECKRLKVRIKEIWFNAWKHLPETVEAFQPLQGEFLGALINTDVGFQRVWNRQFGGEAVVINPLESLPTCRLPNDAWLTLLSPYSKQLARLRTQWESVIREFAPGDELSALERLEQRRDYRPPQTPDAFSAGIYGVDRSAPNGSSIAFLFEHAGFSCLFAGDAHARVLTQSLKTLAKSRGLERIKLDAFKLPHHGSMGNVTKELLSLVDCKTWMISTNGAIFSHPDRAAVELIARIHPDSSFLCNYRVESTLRIRPTAAENWTIKYPDPIGGHRLDLIKPRKNVQRSSKQATRRITQGRSLACVQKHEKKSARRS